MASFKKLAQIQPVYHVGDQLSDNQFGILAADYPQSFRTSGDRLAGNKSIMFLK
jgi:hypothetical protein